MKRVAGVWTAALALLATQALAATTRPAADYSEPKKAIRSFLMADDEAGLRAALLVAPEQSSTVEPFIAVLVATTRLQQAATTQYGQSAARLFRDSSQAQLDARLETIDKAEVRITADTATVIVAPHEKTRQSGATILLKKAGSDWKIDAASMFDITTMPPADLAKRTQLANTITRVTVQMITDIRNNKFASAGDAYKEYWNRTLAASRAGQPSTAPATNPQ